MQKYDTRPDDTIDYTRVKPGEVMPNDCTRPKQCEAKPNDIVDLGLEEEKDTNCVNRT